MKKITLVLVALNLALNTSLASEHGHSHKESNSYHKGANKAQGVPHREESQDLDHERPLFSLSHKAIETLKIKSAPIELVGKEMFEVPESSIVEFQDEVGVYKQAGDSFRLIEVSIISRDASKVRIRTKNIQKNENVVFHGASFLRIAELEASGQGGQGHAH